ncbi:hypothetical protein MHI18_10230 [Peribacillus sp. FSL H8-0477]|uniref:hypothetical protein n=1 Tax=Peribacillus sp. FSL H8-0477 TaxID=2921388 RepID=UPI0030F5FCDF
MNKKKAIKIATASAIAATGFVAVAPAQAAVKTTNVNTVVNTAISKMAAAYDGYHKPGLQGKIPPTAKIRQLTTNAEAAYDAAVAAIAKDGGTKSQKAAFTKKLNAKKYLLTRAQGYVKAIDVNLNAAKKALDKAVASGKAKDVKAAEAALVKTAATFEKAVKAVYGPSTRKVLVAKYHVPALAKAATVKDELTVYNAYKEIESGDLIEKNLEKAGSIIAATEATVQKLAAGDKRDTKLVKNLLDAVAKNKAKYNEKAGVVGEVKSIMAINATTVEVTYKDAVENVDALKYSIEGLTIASAVVKQTDSKTVVLTTSTQDGAKEYTLKSGAIKVGTFKGVSAVIPTAINVTTPSIQGTIGKEVTVKATVTVPEGQSKAGIPVTVNIPATNSLNPAITAEVYTNANGEASYSYTRYSAVNDNVTVYATGDRTKSSTANVYFADALTVSEVTAGNALPNGSKKVYKVTGAANSVVNVTFKENVQVSPDKLVTTAKIEDAVIKTLNPNGSLSAPNGLYPYEVTTGGVQVALVQLNAQGTATFTVTGDNATVTPVVFADGSYDVNRFGSLNKDAWVGNGKLGASELQATAPAVTFALSQTIGLNVKAEGVQNAAANTANGEGGRDYTVTLTDKDGKVAPAGTTAYVVFPKGSFNKDKAVQLVSANGTYHTVNEDERIAIQVAGSKGEATFTLIGNKDAYATPTVYLDNGTDNGKLDSSDLQKVGEITYFVNAVIQEATLSVTDKDTKKEATSVPGNHTATFTYKSVDQNGFDYIQGTGSYDVTYQVSALFNDVIAEGVTVAKGTTKSVTVKAVNGKAELDVTSVNNLATTVNVNASSSSISLPNKSASVTFTSTTAVSDVYTGTIESYSKNKEQVTFEGRDAVSYANATFKAKNGNVIDKKEFEATLASSTVKATYTKTTDGKVSFEIIDNSGTGTPDYSLAETVTGVSTVATSGQKIGDEVDIKVTFSDAVTVTGTPSLALNVGGTKATYQTGSGTKELVFKYKVLSGDTTPVGKDLAVSSINLEGGTIGTIKGGPANLSVKDGLLTGVTIDGIAPVATGDYTSTDKKVITIKFSEAMKADNLIQTNFSSVEGGAITKFERATDNKSVTITFTNELEVNDKIVIAPAVTDVVGNSAGTTLTR